MSDVHAQALAAGKGPWLQFRLRTLLLLVTVASVVFSLVAWTTRERREEARIARSLKQEGFRVDWEGSHVVTIEAPGSIARSTLSDDHLRLIAELSHLRRLHVSTERMEARSTQVTNAGLRAVSRIKSLCDLDFSNTCITDDGLVYLGDMRAISILYIGGNDISDAGMPYLASLPDLHVLSLDRTGVTDNGLALLAGTGINELQLNETSITDAGLRHLETLPLFELELSGTRVTDEGVCSIARLRWLYRLSLARTDVTERGVCGLRGLEQLSYLDLSGTQIRDEALACLADVGQFRQRPLISVTPVELCLRNTSITDAGVRYLEGLQLTVVDLSDTKVTADGVSRLRRGLPRCKITASHLAGGASRDVR